MKDDPLTRRCSNEDLELQAKVRHEKEELAKMKNMETATEDISMPHI